MNANDMRVHTIRVRNRHEPGVFGRPATTIGEQQATLSTIGTVALTSQYTVRDLDVHEHVEVHLHWVLKAIAALPDSQVPANLTESAEYAPCQDLGSSACSRAHLHHLSQPWFPHLSHQKRIIAPMRFQRADSSLESGST